ncbi:MAG: hypothetical protein ACTTIC_02215 [Helicobacteraceae bacterium]
MLERRYKWRGMNVLEVHFLKNITQHLKETDLSGTDLLKLYQVGENYQNKLDEFHTPVTDLTQDEDAIYSGFDKNTRNRIRKNVSDNVEYIINSKPSDEDLGDFIQEHKKFMDQKNSGTNASFNLNSSKDFQQNITITYAKKDKNVLAAHLYLVDNERIRYKYGISYRLLDDADGQLVGRSNRGLHWHDIKLFKRMGKKIYDWGGVAHNTKDPSKININNFKTGFCKTIAVEFTGNVGVSLKGKAAVLLNNLIKR